MTEMDQELEGAGCAKSSEASHPRALVFDIDAYRPHVAEFDLTEEQQGKLLEAVWSVMVAFADLRFRLHPVQHAHGETDDIPLDRILAAMLTFPEENHNNSTR